MLNKMTPPSRLSGQGRACLIVCIVAIAFLVLALAGALPAQAGEHDAPGINPVTKTWTFALRDEPNSAGTDYGAALRVRYVDLENAISLGYAPYSKRQFFRIRSRLWLEHRFSPHLRAYAMLNNESRKYLTCKACEDGLDEIIFENLYIEVTQPFGLPLGLRLGRQDLFYSDGFIICDGTPLDGSRTAYVSGILLTAALDPWSLDAFWAWNRQEDQYLPRINNKYRSLLEFNEMVGGVYIKGVSTEEGRPGYVVENYFIFKEEKTTERLATIITVGGRLGFPFYRANISAEFAYQGGRGPESPLAKYDPSLAGRQAISAYGAQLKATTHLDSPVPLDLTAGYIHLTGDDPSTRNKLESWNPIMGRWPQWSELYIYTLALERPLQVMDQGIAYWQNLQSPLVEIGIRPRQELRLEARHMWLNANQGNTTVDATGRPTQTPTDRGSLLVLKISWQAGTHLSGHLLYERFEPGRFYIGWAKDASFLRLELSIVI
jgi:hypothetical protein